VPDLSPSPFRVKPWEYYPVANTLAAGSSALVSRTLGVLDPFDGFHALNVALGAALVLALYAWLRPPLGPAVAVTTIVFLFLAPRVACDLLANIKDFPTLFFFSVTLIAFHAGHERGSVRMLLVSGASWGLALGTKANALFLPAIPLLAMLAGGVAPPWRQRRARLVLALAAALGLGLALFVASWPYVWSDPIGLVARNLQYIAGQKAQVRPESVAPPLEAILLTTPIPFLLFFAIGLVPLARRARARDRLALLLVSWIAIVLARLHLPNAVNFDGVRHFLEIFPPMAATAALGAVWCCEAAARRFASPSRRALATAALLALPLAPCAWSLARSHPHEVAYWNAFAGGLRGARERGLAQACDYWGLSYRLGLRWINANAPQGALLAVPIVEHAVRLTAPVWLRPDLQLAALTTPVSPDIDPARLDLLRRVAAERPVFVMFVLRDDWMNALMHDCLTRLEPIAQWSSGGAPVLVIYRYTP
jgi:4-amino-4-deoxy-L-arabinose transferase-like glycosyltransferase